jgi:hypothetical protein
MFQTDFHVFLQSFENEFLTGFMRFITALGYIEFFMVFLTVILFVIDFKKGFILLLILFWTGGITFFLKEHFDLPRPFHVDSRVQFLDGKLDNGASFEFSEMGAKAFWDVLPIEVLDEIRKEKDFAHGFRDLTDLHILFTTHRADTVYWERLIELAQASEFEKELQLAIRYCKSLLMTNIPEKYESRIYTLRKTNFTLLDAMFNRVLLPRHPKSDSYDRSFWELLAYMRGHFMKMPFPVLVKHLTIKSWRGLVESTLGKNFYDEAHKQNP